jgi:hypothetical protein
VHPEVRALKKRHRDRHLAEGRRGKPKERTQGMGGSQKEFAVARQGINRRAGVAWYKGHCRQGHGRDDVAPRTQKGRTDENRRWKDRERKTGIRNRGMGQQLHLGSNREFSKTFRETLGQEIVKRAVGISSGLR